MQSSSSSPSLLNCITTSLQLLSVDHCAKVSDTYLNELVYTVHCIKFQCRSRVVKAAYT